MTMKKLLKAVVVLMLPMTAGVLVSCTKDLVPEVVTDDKPFTYDEYMDTSVRPGDDFFRYQYGKWLDDDQLQAMSTITMQKLSGIETEVLASSDDPAIVALRQLAMASETDDAADIALLKERIDRLSAITTQEELLEAFAQLHRWGYSPVVRLVAFAEQRRMGPYLTSELPSLVVIDAFNRKNEEMLANNLTAGCSWLAKLDISKERIAEIVANALAVEKIEMLAYDRGFNRMLRPQAPVTRAETRSASTACRQVCQLMGIGDLADQMQDSDDEEEGEAIEQLMGMLLEGSEESVAKMRDYLIAYVFTSDMFYIHTLSPSLQSIIRMRYAMLHAKYHMFHLQVEAFGPQNIHKERCAEIMEEFRSIFRERIDGLEWMSTTTKQAARKKLDSMLFFIGYPDEWNDEMTPVIEGNTLLEAVGSLRRHETTAIRKMVGKSITTNGWDFWCTYTSFTTFNATYSPNSNQLVILPAFLIAPVFDTSLSEATLYGTAVVFGHEMCHGFDAAGSQYDELGARRDWWTAADREAFQAKQQQLVDLWNQLEQYPGQAADGQKTLQENMADYGGVTLAIEAYSARLRQQGFSGEQFDAQFKKFWLAYGLPVALSDSERSVEALAEALTGDVHSAGHNRVNGIVRLFDDWYRLYDVQPTDKLYLAPADRVKIW